MARSLNKKYFGNRNLGTSGTSDNAIGGEGVAAVTITAEGSYTSALPTATFSTPDLPGGVRATGVVHGHALSAVATAAGSGYNLGDVLTPASTGTYTVGSTFTVTGLTVTGITLNNGGTANDPNDEFTFAIAGFATPLRVRVTAASGGTATAVTIVNGGVWTAGALPTNTIGMTRTQVVAGQDMNGQGLQVNITGWGVATVAVANQGNYTAITGGAKATTVSPAGGTGSTLTVTYGVSGVEPSEKGSGYTSAADAAVTFSAGAAAGTAVLTTDSGVLSPSNNDQGQNASNNQENAIVPYAKTTSGGTSKPADIIRQVGARRFKVKTADGTAICELKGSAVSAEGEMTITATDSAGGTYFVTKIGGRKATVTRGTGTQFATDSAVQWTFDAPTLNTTVKINNA
jgi:hypothetical protein